MIADAQQVFDDFDFVRDFGTAQDRDERTIRFRDHAAEVFDFFFNQRANNFWLVAHRFGDAEHRSVFAMASSKGVVAVDVCESSELR